MIDTKTVFTAEKINQISQWLKTPNLNVLNCGVYALKDILEAKGHQTLLGRNFGDDLVRGYHG